MTPFCNTTLTDLKSWLKEQGEKPFRATQIFDWVYKKGALSWQEMTNLSKELREKLSTSFAFPVLTLRSTSDSKDKETTKFLWELPDKKFVESVLIYSGDRRTVCVSSQVGCPARCAFCASGHKGFFRNLPTAEIVEQVLHINNRLQAKGESVTHVVFMGMGEPLLNYDNVLGAIRLFIGMPIGQRRITISTVGIIDEIKHLAKENLKINLVFSLHAPNQQIRKKIIPYARKYPLEETLEALNDYSQVTKRDITYEYILIEGINDQPEHAQQLIKLLRHKQCTVNLIPYNPVQGIQLRRPATAVIQEFRRILDDAKIINTCRYTKGDDIAAACGQLALCEIQEEERTTNE